MPKLFRVTLILVLLLSLSSVANATTITFDGLAGPNESAFPASYLEAGFTVTPLAGSPEQGTVFGNPSPSVIIGAPVFAPVPGAIEITLTGGGNFTFSSVDLASNNGGPSSFSWVGWLGGLAKYSFGGLVPSGSGSTFFFVTESNPFAFSAILIDRLTIGMAPGQGTTSDNLDNINVSAVPEPSTAILLLLGLVAGVGIWGGRRFPKHKGEGGQIVMARRSLAVLAAVVAILASAAPALAVATLNFSTGGAGVGGLLTVDSSNNAIGTNIPIGSFTAIGTGTTDGDYSVVGGLLNFNTSTGAITINGGIPTLFGAPVESALLLSGLFNTFFVFADSFNATVSGAGPDTKNPDLLTALGLAPDTPFAFFGFTLAAIDTDSTGVPGNTYYVATSTLMINMEQPPVNAVPEPGTLLLLGSGLAAAGIWGRRGFRKQEK